MTVRITMIMLGTYDDRKENCWNIYKFLGAKNVTEKLLIKYFHKYTLEML